uniref:Uncharacterized protein n=1 Tax=Rhizophora mucronata TaxID=61149 RepID=A0A2P2J0U1_RHIMU
MPRVQVILKVEQITNNLLFCSQWC